MTEAKIVNYTDEIGVLGSIKTTLQANGVIIPAELQDELEREWNAPALKRGRFVFLLAVFDCKRMQPEQLLHYFHVPNVSVLILNIYPYDSMRVGKIFPYHNRIFGRN